MPYVGPYLLVEVSNIVLFAYPRVQSVCTYIELVVIGYIEDIAL